MPNLETNRLPVYTKFFTGSTDPLTEMGETDDLSYYVSNGKMRSSFTKSSAIINYSFEPQFAFTEEVEEEW